MTTATPGAEPHTTRPELSARRWVALGFIALTQLMIALDATIVNIALPSAQVSLRFSAADRQWMVTAYSLTFGGLLLFGGRVADLFGRNHTFLAGPAGFAGVSAIGGAATGLPMLVAARAAQGAFAALLAPTALAFARGTFTETRDPAVGSGSIGSRRACPWASAAATPPVAVRPGGTRPFRRSGLLPSSAASPRVHPGGRHRSRCEDTGPYRRSGGQYEAYQDTFCLDPAVPLTAGHTDPAGIRQSGSGSDREVGRMSPVTSSFEIARPPARVYAYITDPARFPEWQHDVVRVHVHGDGVAGVGTRFATTRRLGRVEHTTTQEITEMNPPRTWAARGIDGAFRPGATITIDPIGDGTRSRVTIALDFDGDGIGKALPVDVIAKMAAKGAPKSYQNLKELLEQETRDADASSFADEEPTKSGINSPTSTRGSGPAVQSRDRTANGRAIAYWVATSLVAAELGLGAVWDVSRTQQVRGVVDVLGYPEYFLVILGVWKALGAVALLVPGLPRVKEWAYAGAMFTYTGAIASHLAVGNHPVGELTFLALMIGVTAVSWALRPPARRDLMAG